MLSQGVSMLLHGDELGRTQQGNNNAYCQDSDLSWINWDTQDTPLTEFFATLTRLRKQHPTFRRSKFFRGRPVERGEGQPLPDVQWLHPNGSPMLPKNWDEELARAIAVFYNGADIGKDHRGRTITDHNFLTCFNSNDTAVTFTLPSPEHSPQWEAVLDTAGTWPDGRIVHAEENITLCGKSILVLRAYTPPPEQPDHSVAASLALLRQPPATDHGRPQPELNEVASSSRPETPAP
jgi:glycogen operon protein